MKQVVQNYRTGELSVEDVPAPLCRDGGVLVQAVASAVSAGTERAKVDLARKTLLGKALARPDQVRKVLDTLRKEGVTSTLHKVRNKLDSLSPLGYSVAGRVVAVGESTSGFAVGDAVACAGAGYANHAELIWAPTNLCAAIPDGVELEHAAFTTIGAIALQGIRQAEASFGESIAVIGLGLIGQLTLQLLRAAGCQVVAIDVDPWNVELARKQGADLAIARGTDTIALARTFTRDRGVDAVIITAAAPNNDPFVLAGEIARDRAKIVLVGAVPLEIPRSPYYEKELEVRLSRSYGPGRYDPGYEEKGIDYPVGYVRWTENRNMQAFLRALQAKQVSLANLITHRVPLAQAERAYDLISGEIDERFLGVVLTYPLEPSAVPVRFTKRTAGARAAARVAFIGAGSFAGSTLIPLLKEMPGVELASVCTASGLTARDIARRHGFVTAAGDPADLLDDDAVTAVFVATRHDSHASLAARALSRGKAVFVEKPLALDRDQLDAVSSAVAGNPALCVGFNRRFSPHTARVRRAFAGAGALVIQIRVNAGDVPPSNWVHDPAVGGGRLIGECCHFFDLAQAIAGAQVVRVHASSIGQLDPSSSLRDNACITLELANGSIATITYTSKGDAALGKERVEVFGGGIAAVIDDFHTTTIVRNGHSERFKTKQDKGHREELVRFLAMVTSGAAAPIPYEDLRATTLATFSAMESIASGAVVSP
jgi:polar amino acid transport system substrate-binding protein